MLEDLSYIDCRDLLESTGIKNVSESGGEISFSCPSVEHFHGDRSPSARMNARTSAFLCHNCGIRGNGITFLAWHKSIPENVARRLLEERYGGGRISAVVGTLEDEVKKIMNPIVEKEEERIPPAESWLAAFNIDWWSESDAPAEVSEYILERNFHQKVLFDWDIGYDNVSDRITIPIRDHHGKLVGFKGRAWRENTIPKYMILGDYNNQIRYGFKPYKKSHYVFGLDRFIKLNCDPYVIIVEGELNVLAMDQYGYKNTVGIAGSEFSDIQRDLIIQSCKKAVLFLDNDKAGQKGTRKVLEMLHPYMTISVVRNAAGDAAELDKKTVDELIDLSAPSLLLQAQGMI